MKKLLLVLIVLLASLRGSSQGWEWGRWAKSAAGGSEGLFCAADQYGNVYGAGYYFGSIVFGNDTLVNISGGASAGMLVKYDSLGNVLWAKSTSHGRAYTMGVATDLYDNVYISGGYDTSFILDNHLLQNPNGTKNQYFIAKFSSTGNLKWLKNIGNVAGYFNPSSRGIVTDVDGDIYLTCAFLNSPLVGTFSITNSNTDSTADILAVKFDSSGSVIWAKGFGGKRWDLPMGIAPGPSHNSYIVGYFNSDTLFCGPYALRDTGAAQLYTAVYIAKLDANGDPVWAQSASGGSNGQYFTGVAVNSHESIYVTGAYYATPLTLGTHILPLPPAGSYGFLANYDSSGSAVSVKLLQGYYVLPWVPTVDPCDNVWIISSMGTGHLITNDTIDGHILSPLPVNGDPNFIAGWDSSGSFITASALASGSTDDPNSIVADRFGHVYVIGDQEYCDTFVIASDTNITNGETMFMGKFNTGLNCIAEKTTQTKLEQIFTLYPNPATSTITIQYNKPIQNTTASIYDITSRLMGSYLLTGSSTTISVQNLPPGIYQLRVVDGEHNVVTKKVVVMQ